MKYIPPVDLAIWKKDEPGEELYIVAIQDNGKVVSAYGRFSHCSGSESVTWDQFLAGEMKGLVVSTMGAKVLSEVTEKLNELTN